MKISTLTIEMAANVARLRQDMDRAQKTVDRAMGGISKAAAGAMRALGALGVGVSLAGLVTLVRNFAKAGDEIQRFSTLANTATEQFQKMVYGSQRVGVSQEKLADILKDVQDKVGDFIQTGGGAMADFFENIAPRVGVTADQFRRLGGADALQLYVSSLEKANLSQSDMTFYMEAIASDSTLLLPLLRDNGKAMGELGEEASRLGVILNDETIAAARELSVQLDIVIAQLRGMGTTVASEVLPVLVELGKQMNDVSGEGSTMETVADGIAIALETISVLGLNTSFVLKQIYLDVQGLGKISNEFFTGNFSGALDAAKEIGDRWSTAGAQVEAASARILNARKVAGAGELDEPWVKRMKAASQGGGQQITRPLSSVPSRAGGGASDRAQKEAERLAAREELELLKKSAEVVTLRNKLAEESYEIAQRNIQAAREGYAEQIKAYTDSAANAQQTLLAYQQENEAMALAESMQISMAQAVELTTIARLEEAKVAAMGSEEAVLAIEKEIQARKQLASAINSRDVKEASEKAAKDAAAAWGKTADWIENTLTDALMRGFESGESFGDNLAKSITNTFKTYVAKEISKAITKAIMSALANSQWAGAISSMMGGASGGGGTDWLSLAYKGYQYYNSAGTATAVAAGSGGTAGTVAGTGATGISSGTVGGTVTTTAGATTTGGATSSAAGIGALGWAAIIVAAIYAGHKLYEAGYDRTNLEGIGESNRYNLGVENLLYKINEQTGLLNEKWANIMSGTTRMAHMFGYKLHQTGIRGNFDGAGGIQTDQYQSYKGGWLRGSDKVFSQAMDPAEAEKLSSALRNLQTDTQQLVVAMGGSGDAVRDFAGGVTIDLRGLTRTEALQKMAEEFQELQYRMAEAAGVSKDVFIEMMAASQALMERHGVTGAAISDLLVQGMTGRLSEGDLQAQLADLIMGGIYNSIASVYADQIAQMFTSQIIQPLLLAAMSGAPLAGVVSQATMEGVVAKARQSVAALEAIFSDPAFKQFMSELNGVIKEVAGVAVKPAKHIKAFGTAAIGAGKSADTAAEQIKRAWQQITNSIIDEIRRIRGEVLGSSPDGVANLQAQFAIVTAQARAGSQDAAGRLPGLSRDLIELARETSTSLSDFRAVQGRTLASLEATAAYLARRYKFTLPSFDVGTNYVPHDMLAQVHKGEAIVPARYNPDAGGNAALIAEFQGLKKVVVLMAAAVDRMEEGNKKLTNNYSFTRTKEVTA